MMTYTWEIISKPKADEINGYNDVILAAIWKYIGTDEYNRSAEYMETSFFRLNPDNTFIPYEEITDEIVISWILPTINLTQIENYIASKLPAINIKPEDAKA